MSHLNMNRILWEIVCILNLQALLVVRKYNNNNNITLGSYFRYSNRLYTSYAYQPRTTDNHCLQFLSDQQFNNIMMDYILVAVL